MHSRSATCRVEAPRAINVSTSISRGVSPAGPAAALAVTLAGGGEHGVNGISVEAARADIARSSLVAGWR